MEDTLRVKENKDNFVCLDVLILVLMEDTLRVIESLIKAGAKSVLILVLMEDTLRDSVTTECTRQNR